MMILLNLKPNDIIYHATPNGVDTLKVKEVKGSNLAPFVRCEKVYNTNYYSHIREYVDFKHNDFGEFLFFTKAEAEERMKGERKNNV